MELKVWFAVGFSLRLILILYGIVHDSWFPVPFTDVDYHVFTGAARHVSEGGSPYDQHTYRYPPLVAWLLLPNCVFGLWGKLLFSSLDILISWLIVKVVEVQQGHLQIAQRCSILWLLNPFSIIISARGNSDSVIAVVVLLCLLATIRNRPVTSGAILALAVHIRLYPVVFSLPMYLSFRQKSTLKSLFIPNIPQIKLVLSFVSCLANITYFCYYLYGDQFVNESILYHLTRKDTKHNFSLYFYLLYLNPEQPGIILFLPQALLLAIFSLAFYRKQDLAFCFFIQSFLVVTFNPVVTSQYWVWVLSLLPVCLASLKVQFRMIVFLSVLWTFAQIAWLVPAYLLEFRGRNTFFYIWLQGVGVFCANVAVLGHLIQCYDYFPMKKLE